MSEVRNTTEGQMQGQDHELSFVEAKIEVSVGHPRRDIKRTVWSTEACSEHENTLESQSIWYSKPREDTSMVRPPVKGKRSWIQGDGGAAPDSVSLAGVTMKGCRQLVWEVGPLISLFI